MFRHLWPNCQKPFCCFSGIYSTNNWPFQLGTSFESKCSIHLATDSSKYNEHVLKASYRFPSGFVELFQYYVLSLLLQGGLCEQHLSAACVMT
jgi:aminoglycoside N3'-acetyltransferase